MKRGKPLLFISLILILCVLIPTSVFPAVLLQDNFDALPSNWTCSSPAPLWSAGWNTCGNTAGFGDEMKVGPGRTGGNALYVWKAKHTDLPGMAGFRAGLLKWLDDYSNREWYHRWYMLIPANFDKRFNAGFKFWRYVLRPNGVSNPGVIYLNANGGGTLGTASLSIYAPPAGSGWVDMFPIASIRDGQWHCFELHIKLDSPAGAGNGIVQLFVDGVSVFNSTNQHLSNNSLDGIADVGVGIGNTDEDIAWGNTPSDWGTEWRAIRFDDIVLSTTYVGAGNTISTVPPQPSPPTVPLQPSPPTNLILR